MNAPLFISMDLRHIDDPTKQILLNKDVVAVSQDSAGHPCRCIRAAGDVQVFAKNLADGSVARGPATAPQPAFQTRVVAGAVQIRLPGAG